VKPITRTRAEADLESRIAEFKDDPERVEILRRARSFKSSWVELGESLTRVLRADSWKAWGYDSFEAYCTKELHLRRETAHKLVGTYGFLKTRAPQVLRRDGLAAPIPSLASVEFWKRAEERAEEADAPEASVAELRRAVVDEAQPATELKRRYKEVFFPLEDGQKQARGRQAVLQAARRLIQLVGETRVVPPRMAEDLEEQVGRLIELLTDREAAA
jgi:hypothetical protein